MGHILDKTAEFNGLHKEQDGLSDFERKALDHSSLGEEFFNRGLRSQFLDSNKANEAIKAWESYVSFS